MDGKKRKLSGCQGRKVKKARLLEDGAIKSCKITSFFSSKQCSASHDIIDPVVSLANNDNINPCHTAIIDPVVSLADNDNINPCHTAIIDPVVSLADNDKINPCHTAIVDPSVSLADNDNINPCHTAIIDPVVSLADNDNINPCHTAIVDPSASLADNDNINPCHTAIVNPSASLADNGNINPSHASIVHNVELNRRTLDIGEILLKNNAAEQYTDKHCQNVLRQLSDESIYQILTNHFIPPQKYVFPAKQDHGCNRRCNMDYLDNNFVYSPSTDSVWCIVCALFSSPSKRDNLHIFVNSGYSQWHNIIDKKKRHCDNQYHKNAMDNAERFKSRFENPSATIPLLLDNERKERYVKYQLILEKIARAVHLCGRQGIALRGHRETMTDDPNCNPGNFLAILKELAEDDPVLKEHLKVPLQRNASYIRMQSQNEMIDVIGRHTIQSDIIREIKSAAFHSIIVDEVTASNDQMMSVCIRFVDHERNIREEFLEFISVKRITGEALANAIFQFYVDTGLNVDDLRGQCYDGAANMSSEKKSLSAIISRQNSNAIYMHCNSHILNLSIASTCKQITIRTVLEKMTAIAIFINYSPRREELLQHIVEKNVTENQKRKTLIGLCKTRWTERDTAYEHFYMALPFLVTCFEIINGTHEYLDDYDESYTTGWSADSKKDATAYLNSICDFSFIVGLVSIYRLLHPLHGTTVKLQGKSIDIVKAFEEIEDVKKDIKAMREAIDIEFDKIYKQAVRLAEKVDVEPSVPRSAKRQIHRPNPECTSPEQYYRCTVAIPLLDCLQSELEVRFNGVSKQASKLLFLVPEALCSSNFDTAGLYETVQMYSGDLLNVDVIDIELDIWKRKWNAVEPYNRPSSLAKALQQCDASRFPNISILLTIACTLPVTSCECERSFSVLRRLRPWLRASMDTPRLSSLALMNIHYGHPIDYKKVVQTFLQMHPRRINMKNVIFE
jgi:hypothetical protein